VILLVWFNRLYKYDVSTVHIMVSSEMCIHSKMEITVQFGVRPPVCCHLECNTSECLHGHFNP
jgi:hypothetical protein